MSEQKIGSMRKRKIKHEQDKKDKVKKLRITKPAINQEILLTKTVEPQWSDHELLAEQHDLTPNVAKNIIILFEDGNTVPFIARYRKNVTNNMPAEELRAAKETYEGISALKSKMSIVIKHLQKLSAFTNEIKHAVTAARSIEELEYVYAPYKSGSKRTLAERAKELGLEMPALMVLQNNQRLTLVNYIVKNNKDLSNAGAVEKGIIHVIASIISTNTEILSSLRELRRKSNFIIKTKKMPRKNKNLVENKRDTDFKFDNYIDFEIPVKLIKPHQVLAINRGESLKILSVKVVIPDTIFHNFKQNCYKKWLYIGEQYPVREHILKQAVGDSYNRLVEPLIKREVRSELKQKAERASCEVFSTNLKHLLLASPLKGKYILAIDPGFSTGCKLALISPMGNLVISDTIYPHTTFKKEVNSEKDVTVLKNILLEFSCELIALGNGTACRQTEEWLSNLIQNKVFQPLDVQYTIVREDGASIYSCSPEAKKEFPKLDPNIISAVSLARRLQDPLAELVKVEPKHLGIGMYQHDLKRKQLEEVLNDVVSECVSFVGVNLNTASVCLLRHVAGLSEKRAQQIIDYRSKNGPFICRTQLLEVSGIGQKIFQQCAGFLRVGPLHHEEDNFYKNAKATKLDCTNIHPESYDITGELIKTLNLKSCEIGKATFTNIVKKKLPQLQLSILSREFKSNTETIQLILNALCQPLNHDFRFDCLKEPIFKKYLTSINDINSGSILTGIISNVTHFGCFVDIGVGVNGLIHVSKYNGLNMQIGNKVEVKVINIDVTKNRIGLQAQTIL